MEGYGEGEAEESMVKGCVQDSENSHIYLPQLVLNEGLPTKTDLFSVLTEEQSPLLYYPNITV
jgi:hypothetical protein